MDVSYNGEKIMVDFNDFEINKKTYRILVKIGAKVVKINFKDIKPTSDNDQKYFDYISKEYHLISVQQNLAQKKTEKKHSRVRVCI